MEGADASVQAALKSGLLTQHQIGNQVELKCTVCLCQIKGVIPAAEHLKGDSHAKVQRRSCSSNNPTLPQNHLDLPPGLPKDIVEAVEAGYLQPFVKDGHPAFHCNACQAPMTGIPPTLGHLHGEKHRKRLRNQTNMGVLVGAAVPSHKLLSFDDARASASPEVDLEEEMERGTVEQMEVMGSLYYKCKICNVSMAGREPLRSHLNGKPHKKSAARQHMDMKLTSLGSSSSNSSSNSSLHTSASAALHPSLTAQSAGGGEDPVADALSSGVLVEISGGAFMCNVCCTKSAMTGRTPALGHITGAPHFKAMARASQFQAQRRVCSTPNGKSNGSAFDGLSVSAISPPVTSTQQLPADSVNDDSPSKSHKESVEESVADALAKGILVLKPGLEEKYECCVCNKAMVGKTPAAAHIKGASHLKAERRGDGKVKMMSSSADTEPRAFVSSSVEGNDAVTPDIVHVPSLLCKVCSVTFRSQTALTNHLGCDAHAANLEKWAAKRKAAEVIVKSTSAVLSALPVDAGQLDMLAFVQRGEVQVLVRGEKEAYKCVLCEVELTSVPHLRGHLLGRNHTAKTNLSLEKSTSTAAPVTAVEEDSPLNNNNNNNDDDDDRSSTSSGSNDLEPIIIGEDEIPKTSPAFQAFLANVKRKTAKKCSKTED